MAQKAGEEKERRPNAAARRPEIKRPGMTGWRSGSPQPERIIPLYETADGQDMFLGQESESALARRTC